jgi:hypothetical protein
MAKSKKGQRTVKAGGRRVASAARPARAGTPRTKRVTAKPTRGAKSVPVAPAFTIRELDPLRLCGGATSVVQLFRADERPTPSTAAKGRQTHLVFNDRHGWYCEHGRSCHAVSAVMRHAGIR